MVLVSITVMDNLMGAVFGPTLIFYVTELGGTKEQYGMICSAVALSTMIAIPIYGTWVDSNGNKYTVPYLTSYLLGILSSIIYFLTILLPKGSIAIYSLLFSRLLGGASIAGRTLAYSWVASAIPPDEQRGVFSILSASKTIGMIAGPVSNYLVSKINTEFKVLGVTVPINSNNSIGLLMVGGQIILIILTLSFLQEPHRAEKKLEEEPESGIPESGRKSRGVWYALTHFSIFFPVFTMFIVVCHLSLLETALPPVARNMGWSPVEISEVSACGSTVMALSMVLSLIVAMGSISDNGMISFGFGTLCISGLSMYVWWTEGVGYLQFTLPTYLIYLSYPFIGPANRTTFTNAVRGNKELEGSHGIMMSLIQQASALASFICPSLVARFVLRNKEDIEASLDKHQITAGVLSFPLLSSLVIGGLIYQHSIDHSVKEDPDDDPEAVSESTSLL
eukprot:jgi/Psemu1/236229/estExt_Genewise1.C_420039